MCAIMCAMNTPFSSPSEWPDDEAPHLPLPAHIPFLDHLGLTLHACAEGRAEVRLALLPEHLNSYSVAHGGVVMTLLDVGMALAARSHDLHGPGVVTIEMKSSFMRPSEGPVLRSRGRVLHRSATMAFCEAAILNSRGTLCAHATGTFKYLRALPGQGRQVKAFQRAQEVDA
jgi:uncharacterized protein (TIGR00369 family)